LRSEELALKEEIKSSGL